MISYNNKMPKAIGVIEKRQSRGWTQEQLAQISGIDARTIQRVESKKTAALSTLQALASAFECSVDDIIEKPNSEGVNQKQTIQDDPSSKKDEAKAKEPKVHWLFRIKSGKDLMDIMEGADAFQQDYDEPQTAEEADTIAGFLQNTRDYGEIWGDIEPSQRVKAAFECNDYIKDVEALGLSVFAIRRKVLYVNTFDTSVRTPMSLAVVILRRSDDPRIVKKDGIEVLPSIFED